MEASGDVETSDYTIGRFIMWNCGKLQLISESENAFLKRRHLHKIYVNGKYPSSLTVAIHDDVILDRNEMQVIPPLVTDSRASNKQRQTWIYVHPLSIFTILLRCMNYGEPITVAMRSKA